MIEILVDHTCSCIQIVNMNALAWVYNLTCVYGERRWPESTTTPLKFDRWLPRLRLPFKLPLRRLVHSVGPVLQDKAT